MIFYDGSDFKIYPEYSAVASKGYPSRSIKLAISLLKLIGARSVIEVGCGLLANTPYLLESFEWVILVDTPVQLNRIENKLRKLKTMYPSLYAVISSENFKQSRLNFDSAVLLNVLHVIPSKNERIELLRDIYSNLREGGVLYVDSPRGEGYYKKSLKNWQRFQDGWIIPRGRYATFYKELTVEELTEYLHKAGFDIISYPKLNHRVIALAEKPPRK